jgi:hypothetical protein
VDESEVLAFLVSLVLAVTGMRLTHTRRLHPLYFRGNPGPGIVRLGVILAMAWIAYVLWRHADPSVTGIYVAFYLVMGYAAVKLFGQALAAAYGARTRVDVAERRNVPAALLVATFTLATGLIFGGSLWGEADPVGDDEGGWWIPVSFFVLGWGCLLLAFALFLRRERGRLARRIQRERSLEDARAAAFFLLAAAVVLTDAVAGDFWGWRHGLLTFGVLAALLLVHERFSAWTRAGPTGEGTAFDSRRLLESGVYLLLGLSACGLGRLLDATLGPG